MINLNPEDAALSAQVLGIAEQLYGERPQLRKFHSQVSYVCALEFATLPPKVIKLERNEPGVIVQELRRLRALHALGLPVPPIEHSSDDCGIVAAPFFVTPLLASLRLGDLIWARLPAALPACRRAGAFLRWLHSHRVDELPPGTVGERETRDFAALAPQLTGRAIAGLEHLVSEMQTLEQTTSTALCHGQLHTENVVADAAGAFGVVDWDTLCAGSLWPDVALFLRSLGEWNNGTAEHRQAFWDGLELDEAEHQRDVQLATLLETASSLDWRLAEGFAVEPAQLAHIRDVLERLDR